MAITSAQLEIRMSGGASNSAAISSLGGTKSSTAFSTSAFNLYDTVSGAESGTGDTEYRCVYVHNANTSLTAQNTVIWFTANTAGNWLALGAGTSAINGTEQTVVSEDTAPIGITFTAPSSAGAAVSLGSIPPGQHKAVWFRRVVPAGAAAASYTFAVRVTCESAA